MKKNILLLTLILFFSLITTKIYANTSFEFGIPRSTNNIRPYPGNRIDKILNDTNSYYIGEDNKNIYLTFDCGYENGYTLDILEILKETDTPACFFITGHYLTSSTDIVKKMVEYKQIVANHTYHHYSFNSISNDKVLDEVKLLEEKYYDLIKEDMSKFVRPPMGHASYDSLSYLNNNGYTSVFWSLAYVDWDKDNFKGSDYAYNNVIDRIHNGSIILMHAVSRDNRDALYDIITNLKLNGYTFNSLYDLL